MRTYLLILALALLKVSMARPTEDDFTIDMYEGNRHLRYERSDDQALRMDEDQGNVVTVHNVDADHALQQNHNNDGSLKETTLTAEDSINLAKEIITEWDAKTSEGQKTEVEAHNVHYSEQDSASTVNKDVVEPVAVKNEEVKEEVKAKQAATKEEAASLATKSTSKIEISTGGSSRAQVKEETVGLSKPRYLFQYGDVLNLINQDKVSPLSSKSNSKSGKSKKLSKGGPSRSGQSLSYSIINGKEYSESSPINVVSSGSDYKPSFAGPIPGYGGPRPAFGAPGPAFHNPAHFAVPMYAAGMHDQVHNLRSNIKMGLHGFGGGRDHRGVQMLNLQRPLAPFPVTPRFRPF